MFEHTGKDQPENPAQDESPREVRLPNLSTWRVRRFPLNPTTPMELEEHIVMAHGIVMQENGALIFQVFKVDPVVGPTPVVSRAFFDYYDLEDITPVPISLEGSRIIH